MEIGFHTEIGLGSIPAQEQAVSAALEVAVEEAKTYTRQQASVNMDETGWQVHHTGLGNFMEFFFLAQVEPYLAAQVHWVIRVCPDVDDRFRLLMFVRPVPHIAPAFGFGVFGHVAGAFEYPVDVILVGALEFFIIDPGYLNAAGGRVPGLLT
jgi:hypothetical protein